MQGTMGGQRMTLHSCPAPERRRPFQCVARKQLTPKESRIGKVPIKLPQGVSVKIDGQHITVKGPRGELAHSVDTLLEIQQVEDGSVRISKRAESRRANEQHGLWRTLTANLVEGTSKGFSKELTLIGVGYRAQATNTELTLNLGYSHPVVIPVPKDIQVQVEKNVSVKITGNDKAVVGDFAAKIRAKRPPEPYKQKGVRYVDEVVRKKEGKRGK